jgi:hypothetical protein
MRSRLFEAVMPRHVEATAIVDAAPETVCVFVDDHARFSSHMGESSWMMAGSRMSIELDAAQGRAVGSHIRLTGRVLGFPLFLDEVVTRRLPPAEKVWQTVGQPRLMVIGAYTMGIAIAAHGNKSRLRVFIDYELPGGLATYWLGWLFSGLYARWCVNQMVKGVAAHFSHDYLTVPGNRVVP